MTSYRRTHGEVNFAEHVRNPKAEAEVADKLTSQRLIWYQNDLTGNNRNCKKTARNLAKLKRRNDHLTTGTMLRPSFSHKDHEYISVMPFFWEKRCFFDSGGTGWPMFNIDDLKQRNYLACVIANESAESIVKRAGGNIELYIGRPTRSSSSFLQIHEWLRDESCREAFEPKWVDACEMTYFTPSRENKNDWLSYVSVSEFSRVVWSTLDFVYRLHDLMVVFSDGRAGCVSSIDFELV